ncbi:signal peptidase I [Dorea sp. 5-2]|nr:signal peptidase I [Dorea sp. 5-2]
MEQKDTQNINPSGQTEEQDAPAVSAIEPIEAQSAPGADTAETAETQNAPAAGIAEAAAQNAPAAGVAEAAGEQKPPAAEAAGGQDTLVTSSVELPSLELLEAELKKEQYKRSYRRVLKSTAFSLMVVAAVAVLIAVLLLPVLQISGTSMTDTLQNEDIVVAVNSSKFKTGDVVAFYYNNNILIKRVIASSGDWVDIDEDGNVYVNEVKLDEPYVKELALGECDIDLPYQVPDKKCFVMGDHRATSIDSRSTAVGCVSDDAVVGKILFRVWPLSEIGFVK